jgi:ribosomal protein S18 acetylase RimI-like enzyme
MPMTVEIRSFTQSDYDQARALWEVTPGVGLSAADEPKAIASYLSRNPRTSFVAVEGELLVGTILCGHDGRRGLIHHLATATSRRRRGIARALLQAGLRALHEEGIYKCHLFVFRSNHEGFGSGAQLQPRSASSSRSFRCPPMLQASSPVTRKQTWRSNQARTLALCGLLRYQ